ncbi:MAG: GHKL domain-containing protein [Firmicutes bacterium]|nr:GHKL domain-containing protein [Bacillota bacterium]
MWIQWGADIIILLGVLLLWKVLLPDNNEKWKIKLFGHFTLPIRWLQLAGSFTLLAIFVGFIEISKTDLQPRVLLILILIIAVLTLFFRKFPLSFTVMHTYFALTVVEYLKLLFQCFVPLGWSEVNELLLVNGSMFVCVILIQWVIQKRELDSFYYEHRKLCWIIMAVVGVPIILLAQMLQNMGQELVGNLPGIFMLMHFLLLCMLGVGVVVYRNRQENQQIAANQRYIHSMEAYVDSARVRAHDYRKHINYLHNLVMTQDNIEELRREVQEYYSDLSVENQLNDVLLHLDDPLMRALLFGQSGAAQREGIGFKVSATPRLPDFPIPAYKLVEIFQNLMDNAMDAVRNLEPNRRWIGVRLSCEREGDAVVHSLMIENPAPDDMPSIAQMTEKNFTTKKDGEHQGLGLYQVSRLLAKNGGELLLEESDGLFKVEVAFRTKEGNIHG